MTDTIKCTIERRLLINYRIDPDVVAAQLPSPFRPQVISGSAVGGVCFIRLGDIRPNHVPSAFGLTTENVAHRFAVEWDDNDGFHIGVYVPRRDTNSRITSLAGGRVFKGEYQLARFDIHEHEDDLKIDVASRDRGVRLSVVAHQSHALNSDLFGSVDAAIEFFRRGSLSYSPGRSECFDGVHLVCDDWRADPVSVDRMASSLFDDKTLFPEGTCTLDSGLVMRDLPVTWQTREVLRPREMVGAKG